MQVSVEDVSSVKKILHIEIPEEDVTREMDNAYSELNKNAKIKGFRPGKVPRAVLVRLFKKEASADVSSRLIQDSLINAIRDKKLNVVGNPQISQQEIEIGKPYAYTATIEVNPDLGDIGFEGLSLKRNVYQVGEPEIALQLKMLQRNLAKHEPSGEHRPIVEGDMVMVDYEIFENGKPLTGSGKIENDVMILGAGKIDKSFDDQIIGMSPNEVREIRVAFPEQFQNPQLAGKTVDFKVTLKEIRKENLPEINDDFAKQYGKYQTLDELKEDIRKDLSGRYEKRADQDIQEQIFSTLIGKKDFEVPEAMVAYELESILTEIEGTFAYHNTSAEQLGLTREALAAKYHPLAVKQVKRHLILSRIIEQEKLELPEEDLRQAYQDMAQTFGQPVDQIRDFYRDNQDKAEYLKHTLLEKRAIRLIIERANIEDITTPAKEENPE